MKKIYTLALAALTMLSASAGGRKPMTPDFGNLQPATSTTKAALPFADRFAAKAPARAEANLDINDVAGPYSWEFETLLQGLSGPIPVEIKVGNADANELIIVISDGRTEFNVKATIDLKTGELTVPNMQTVGSDSVGPIYFYLKALSEAGDAILDGATSEANCKAQYKNGVFTFDTYCIWAIGDPNAEEYGYYIVTYANKLAKTKPIVWNSRGKATFQDGWIMPLFGEDQTMEINWWQVDIEQREDDPNIWRLVDPYRGTCPFVEYNQSVASHGYIQFNLSDPNHVYFDLIDAGFANNQAQLSKTYCYNQMTYCMLNYNVSAEDVVATIGNDMQYATYSQANKVLTLPYYYSTSSEYTGYTSDAVFGDQSNPKGGFQWNSENGTPVNMECKIFFDAQLQGGAVDAISADDNAPVRYYNMQGVEVANPAGGLFIRTQGSKAEKVVLK